MATDPEFVTGFDDNPAIDGGPQLSPAVAVTWQEPADERGFSDMLAALPAFQWSGSNEAFQTWAASIDAAQVNSGLSRPDFFHWLSVYRPDVIQSLTDSAQKAYLASQDLSWWEKYLPEIIGLGGFAASFIFPAAFGEVAAGAAASGAAAATGGAAVVGAGGAAAAVGAPSLTALVAALVGPTAAIVHAATNHPSTTTPAATTPADTFGGLSLTSTEWLALAVLAIVLFSTGTRR